MSAAGSISPIPREARPFQGQRAGLVTRVIANTVDGLLVGVITLAIWGGVAVARFLFHPRSFSMPQLPFLLQTTCVLTLLIGYLTIGWAVSGRTYGCHLMGLRVVNFRGGRLRPVTSLLRAVFCVFFPIGLLWCAASRQNRSLQDTVLRSSVIYDWSPRAPWRQERALPPVTEEPLPVALPGALPGAPTPTEGSP
ncbi:RDD family protein [Angustibacter luteus]|uniref:RDD family protein n=1 Tax=Angustibacter luteus TaxID=658456 RepID=A0ABW1JFR0_9ACTN